MKDEEIIDAAFLQRLRGLFVRIRRRRRMRRAGPQQTASAGHTREFKDHRHYVSGDDHRAVDWKLYARLDRLFIRVFEEIQEFHVHLLIDRSRSMAEPCPAKRRDALRLAVGLGYLGLANGHRVSLHAIGDGVRRELPPLKGQGHIHGLVDHLLAMRFDGGGDLAADLARARPADRRGVAFIISDLYGSDPTTVDTWLRPVRGWPCETHIVRVHDPSEAEPGAAGEVQLEDVETGERRRMHLGADDQARYRSAYAAFADTVERTLNQWQVGNLAWSTAKPFDEQFLDLLARGGALGA